jgi:prevent-host-death family protein
VKRDISELINQVAFQGERIVLTSHGRPKAVLISVEDYARLQAAERGPERRTDWLASAQALSERIRQRRGNQGIDIDALIATDQDERDARHK